MTATSPAAAAHGTIAVMDLEKDLAGIRDVDAAAFTNPWTTEMFRADARSDVSRTYVYRSREAEIIGYCAVWRVADEVHVNNLAVLPAWRRRGVATELLDAAFLEGARHGARRATLEVRASNTPARRLYCKLGFQEEGLRKDYYTGPNEDAVILWCDLREGP